MSPPTQTPFPAESLLQAALPDYSSATAIVSTLLVLSFVFWVMVVPLLLNRERQRELSPSDKAVDASTLPAERSKHMDKRRRNGSRPSTQRTQQPKTTTTTAPKNVVMTREAPMWGSALTVAGLMATSLIIVLLSPYNVWLARRVFQAPLLTADECDEIVRRSNETALRNVGQAQAKLDLLMGGDHVNGLSEVENKTITSLLQDPPGWQKMRHGTYPTVDLNLVTDPFTKEDRAYIGGLLHKRLSPLLARIFGIPQGSIRTNDMFVVRYDEQGRTHLKNHSDDGDISFNILLNDDFTGGGTRFWNRRSKAPFAHVTPTQKGTVLAHSALIHHEGYHVTSGTRLILVGFTAVDRIDPWQQTWTGLSWLASYANLNWMTVKVKDSVYNSARRLTESGGKVQQWEENKYVRFLFRDMYNFMKTSVDWICEHTVVSLVAEKDKSAFLKALDDGYVAPDNELGQASWFKGQQIYLNVDGTIDSEWGTRMESSTRFEEL